MEESTSSTVWDGRITGVRFGLATVQEICTSSNSDFPISHASQLANSFLGLPLECGKCESCGAAEAGQCEGHFGYIELPIPVYHPSHLSELKRLLSVICLKCLKVKNRKFQVKNIGILERALSSCCEEASQISINEARTTEGACYLQLKLPSRSRVQEGFWNFLERYGYRYGDKLDRTLLPSEVMVILKKLPADTKRKLAAKGFFPQDGYIMQNLPVPPNCLSVPDISDGITVMSSDLSITMLKKILKKIEIIKSSRSGMPNFEAHQVEANDLQVAIAQYLDVRGTSKASRDLDARFGINKESNDSTKAWLEKMKTLFIRKGSGFSSRSVITGDAYKGVNEIGLPSEIAQRITFEERVTQYNMQYLQKLVDEKLCLTYRDGQSTYSLREGSKGHTFLRPGQVVHRRVMDGDIVFINRPPTTHKHSLQALAVYIHNDHTVKINPLICGPLSADFDGDCIHLFYPQSLAAKAEVVELFSVEKQLLSSHSGNLNLQLATDSLLSLKVLFKKYLLTRVPAQQLAMFLSNSLPEPALLKPQTLGHQWTASQIIQTALPRSFDCLGDKYIIRGSEILNIEFNRDTMQSSVNEILASIFHEKGPDEVLKFFNSLQPLLMENLFTEGFSVDLKDFYIPRALIEDIQSRIQEISSLLFQMRRTYNELVQLQIDSHLRLLRLPIANFILSSSSVGDVIDSKSDSAISKVVQQVGFLGIQLSDKGKFYSKTLVGDMASLFQSNYPFRAIYPAEEFGLVTSCLFHGLDPYQEMVHSISAREVIVRSSRGLTEPGTLFKNLMAILRDVVICYDGTVRNVCSNAVIQFQYGITSGTRSLYAAGEPVGVLAATAMSNPAYKAVLDSSSSSNSSWEMMKEILLCPVTFKNDLPDRRVILYLNDCECGRKYCRENAAYVVKNLLKKVSLKDIAVDFSIEYSGQQILHEGSERDGNLLGHVHLNKLMFQDLHVSMLEVCEKVQDRIDSFLKRKGMKKNAVGQLFKRLKLSGSECCSFGKPCGTDMPCLTFCWEDISDLHVEETSQSLAHLVLPVLLETIITGDPRVCMANIIWIAPDTTTWIRNPSKNQKGELALDVILEKDAVKQSGDAWRVVLDSCLPVIHLIDTSRSIPHAIKQVQELLGISCAFNQAVQRLSTSVSMVAKGVVKEHLILLANSMTCAGNLVGFNSGGIKALSRSLSVQVPFAEATLFTPKKCFEKAAEKCHVDSLASIVASCSWGKQVSVGTGCRFDVLWDTREVGKNQQDGIDVYNFLHLVRSSSKEEANTSACLGAEIDDLDLDYDNAEWGLSPEHSSDKPIFEDSFEFQNGLENPVGDLGKPDESNWVKGSSVNAETSGKDWGVDKSENWGAGTSSSKPNGWSSWGADAVRSENILPTGAPQAKASVTWNSTNVESSKVETPSTENDSPGDLWGVGKKSDQNSWDTTTLTKPNGGPSSSSTWGVNTVQRDDVPPNSPWTSGKKDEPSADSGDGTKWSEGKKQRDDVPPNNPWSSSKKDDASADSGDGKKWFAGKKQISGDDTTLSKPSGWSDWGTNSAEDNSHETGKIVDSVDGREWCTEKKQSSRDATTLSKPSGRSDWGTHSTENSLGTGKNVDSGDGREWFTGKKQNSGDGTALSKSSEWSSWGANSVQTDDESLATGQQKESPVNIWSPSQGGTNGQSPWGQPKRFSSNKDQNDSPRGWGSTGAGDWKAKASGNLTATRQRLDMFTSEEQDILLDVEPIMQAIRRIMHQTGCNDGDPLSADDQSYILENVFNHHPDKTAKMGVGIDYLMVNKHSNFQDTRCFYVVLTDGHREDFSYRKCLENFVKCKYPDQAEAFNGKYFRKPRPPLNRERSVSVAPEEARADKIGSPLPPLNREDSVAPEEAGADKIESS